MNFGERYIYDHLKTAGAQDEFLALHNTLGGTQEGGWTQHDRPISNTEALKLHSKARDLSWKSLSETRDQGTPNWRYRGLAQRYDKQVRANPLYGSPSDVMGLTVPDYATEQPSTNQKKKFETRMQHPHGDISGWDII